MVKTLKVDWGFWFWAAVIVALCVAIGLGGCTTLTEVQGKTAKQLARALHEYCSNTDESFRKPIRDDTNAELDALGGKARIPDKGLCL